MNDQTRGGLGQWLAEKCQREGLSLRQAAKKTGLSHVTIADIHNGSQPSPETLKRLARAFGGNGHHHRLALEDKLLILAGYRSPRPDEAPNEPLAELLDKLTELSESELEMVGHFVDFVDRLEKK